MRKRITRSLSIMCTLGALWVGSSFTHATAQPLAWQLINQSFFPQQGQDVLVDWMQNIFTPQIRQEIYKEMRYQAGQMVAKYANPVTTLRIVVGWDENNQDYIWATRRYTDPEYQGCFRTRTNTNCCGHIYGLLQLVKTYSALKTYYPNDPVTRDFKAWLEKAVDHAFRFGLAWRSNKNHWEIVGEAQPLGGHPAVTQAQINADPLKIHPAIGWFLGKPIENWDGDLLRHNMMTIPGGAEALRDPTLNINRALVKKGLSLLAVELIDSRLGGDFNTEWYLKHEAAYGKLRLFQVLMNLSYLGAALENDAQYKQVSDNCKLTALYIFDSIVRRGPRTFKSRNGTTTYSNWVSGWNPPEWEQLQPDTFPGWVSFAFFDSVWIWGVSTVGPALAQFYSLLDENDYARKGQVGKMLTDTADLYRYRADMPLMHSNAVNPVRDRLGYPMANAPSVGGTFGSGILAPLGTQVMRGFYQTRPALRGQPATPPGYSGAGLLPEEYLFPQEWAEEQQRGVTYAKLFREAFHRDPKDKAIHTRLLEELWAHSDTTSPYNYFVLYPTGHAKAGQVYYVDSLHNEVPQGTQGAVAQVRESNTSLKVYKNGQWGSTYQGFNCLNRSNDFGISSLFMFAGLVTRDSAYMDLAVYTFLAKLKNDSGPLTVETVDHILDIKHDGTTRRRNKIYIGDYTGNPFVWGRLAWHFQTLGILDGWW